MSRVTCSGAAAACGETLPGKAPVARYWVLLERPRPWPFRAEEASPPALVEQVAALGSARLGLIRRRGSRSGGQRLFLVDTLTGRMAAGDGQAPPNLPALLGALAPAAEPMFLVCVHKLRDACCGRLGTPVAAALSARYPALTWETSHIGGHRLAANLVCLPHGYVFGRLSRETALQAAELYSSGRLLLDACRGRSCFEPPQQAAEVLSRQAAGADVIEGWTAPVREVRRTVLSEAEITSCRGERGELVNYEF